MPFGDFTTLRTHRTGGVLTVELDNPPVNVLSATMMRELRDLLAAVRDDSSVKVIVFESANPEFFLAHVDMRIADDMAILRELAASARDGVNVFQSVGELIRHQPQVTIVKLAGVARGGGAEFVAAADMTFAADTARIGQIEALMGITPGGGATQYLRERVGRHRALEIVLTGESVDAATAAAYGWINRVVPAGELDDEVGKVASGIAALADGVVEAAKRTLPPADHGPALAVENDAWASLVGRPAATRLMSDALGAGAQTVEGERDLEDLMRGVRR